MCLKEKLDFAVLAYRKAIDDGFSSARLRNNLAYALSRLGQREQSVEILDQAIAADSSLAAAYYQRAALSAALSVQAHKGIPPDAIRDIETAIRLQPANRRFYLTAAQLYARHAEDGGTTYRTKAINAALESIRLGLEPAALPRQGPWVELVKVMEASPKYAQAVAAGSRAERPDFPSGLLDSLADLDFDEGDELTAPD